MCGVGAYLFDEVAVDVVDDVGVLIFFHHFDFCDNQLFLRLIVQVHHFDCDHLARLVVVRLTHCARGPENPMTSRHNEQFFDKLIFQVLTLIRLSFVFGTSFVVRLLILRHLFKNREKNDENLLSGS